MAKSGNSDNTEDKDNLTYINIIKAKFLTEKDNETINIINDNISNKLNITLFINGKEKTFNNQYFFEEKNEYFLEFHIKGELQNLNELFMNINNLKDIDLSGIKTDKVKNMSKLFYKCESLETINLTNLNTYNVLNMKSMFE